MTTDIISTLVGATIKDLSHVIKQGWQGTRPFMTGCLIITDNVFSICTGTVAAVGQDEASELYTVTVEYDYVTWVRYCNLQSCDVDFGDRVVRGTKIGNTYKGELRIEYCTDEFSQFVARTTDRQLYKHDPMPVLAGIVSLPDKTDSSEE